jgi:hypothetical protein
VLSFNFRLTFVGSLTGLEAPFSVAVPALSELLSFVVAVVVWGRKVLFVGRLSF